MIWYRSQSIVAAILLAYELVAIFWYTDTTRFEFPLANFLGFIAIVTFIPGVIISLLVNQEVLVRRGNPVVAPGERRLLAVEFAAIAASLVALGIQWMLLENLVAWIIVIVLAVLILRRLRLRKPAPSE